MATQKQEHLEKWRENELRLQREEFRRKGSQEEPALTEYERWRNHQAELERQYEEIRRR